MKRSPRPHLERLEDRITPIGPTPISPYGSYPPPMPPPDQVVVSPPPPALTYYIPTPAEMIAAMNAYLATLPNPTPPGPGGDGLGTGLGGGPLGTGY
jgi:hypothetical protein